LPKIDFCISSPPYWNILQRSTGNFEKNRTKNGYDIKYSNESDDLGNIEDYNIFLEKVCNVYEQIYDIMKDGAYICIIVKNIKKNSKVYTLAWDIAKRLSNKFILKDEKIWCQDKTSLAPFGYPFVWTSNIVHHYCIILRKEGKNETKKGCSKDN
jgi:DNA modification methylase